MLTFKKFTGINNVVPAEHLKDTELVAASNIDISDEGKLLRRQGYTLAIAECHRNLWEGPGFKLATNLHGALVAIVGTTETDVFPAIGHDRVWYCRLPDGRVVFSNGLIDGVTAGGAATDLCVPVPEQSGEAMSIPGALNPGTYQWCITHVRDADRLEGGTTFGGVFDVTEGGILLAGLPVLEGYSTNVYLTSANGDAFYLAGNTMGPSFSFSAKNDTLVLPCYNQFMTAMPVGILHCFWRGRLLAAVGNALVASRVDQWHLHDPAKDVKRFSAPITLIQPVDDGVYVGTEQELVFLSGTTFDALAFVSSIAGRVVLGSGVSVPAEKIGSDQRKGRAMMCIAGREICAGFASGSVDAITAGRYESAESITEVFAAFREVRGIPQYLATPA